MKSKINWKLLIITCGACLLPIVFGLTVYDQLPEQMAIHFNINNVPDNYASKFLAVVGLPALMALLQAFCCIVSDINDGHKEANRKALTAFKWIIPVTCVAIYATTIAFSLGNPIDIRNIAMATVGVACIVIGNYIPKTKRAHFINLPRDKKGNLNPLVIRWSSRYMIAIGLLSIISCLFAPWASIAVLILLVIGSLALSVFAWKRARST